MFRDCFGAQDMSVERKRVRAWCSSRVIHVRTLSGPVAIATPGTAATIREIRMSAKHKQRYRPEARRAGNSLGPPSPSANRGFGWKLSLFVGLCIIGLACWFATGHGKHSDAEPAPSRTPTAGGSNQSANGPSARPATAVTSKNKALIAEVDRANELVAQGKPAEAVEILAEAARLNPENDDIHYNLGLALTREGKTEEAIKQYEEALRIFPDYVEAHNNLGNLLLRAKRTEEAIAHFERAVKIMPDYASAHNNLGTALQKTGRTNEAFEHFQQAAKINPDYWEAHFNVGTSCLQQGRLSEARTEFETVLRLKPDFQPAKSLLAKIQVQQSGGAPSNL